MFRASNAARCVVRRYSFVCYSLTQVMAHPPSLTLAGLLLGFLLFVAPSEANKCTSGCHGIHTSKAYQAGRTYTYQLDGESVTSVTDAQGEATLKLNALVELSVKPDCIHQIRLKNVRINGAPASEGEIERHALQFNYHNGHIDTEVCAEADDTQASLNVKRAVISLFQDATVQDDGTATNAETDVFGNCPTEFTFSKNGESRTIKKYRNLEQCSYRENIKQDLISATFNPNSKVKSTPLLAGELEVEQQFNGGILSKASSVETYKYKPFSNGEAGAKTVVETTLTFKGESGGGNTAPVSEPKSLIFEAPHQVVKSSVEAITRALQATKESMPDAVTQFAARRFAELIKVLRQSSERDILTVFARVKAGAGFEKESARKILLDALFRTGTGESAAALVALVKNREIAQLESIIYYTSLMFVRHASLPSVTAVTSLLDQPNIPRVAYLGIGSVIGKYCQEHKCENVPEVNAALAKISSKLNSREKDDVVISALKGLGNARYLDDATLLKIVRLATDVRTSNRIRIAALEALPTRCSMKWKEPIFLTLADLNEDSEIRIKAYLSLVACPCPHVANKLKEVLDKETINQVGSFITSHLRNLRASTNPDKLEAQRQLGLIKPRTKFPEDFRKFSYNNELSYSIDAFGVGSSAESNVIYSQNSFIPRSANLNLTTEIFGHSFNFLEIDVRQENLDDLVERYLGPKGVLRPSNLKDVVLDGRKTYEELVQKIVNRFHRKTGRHARQVSQRDIENFGKQIHLPDDKLKDNLELDLSIKLFGAELAFLSYEGGKATLSPETLVDQILNIIESGVDKAKHFDYHFKNHLHFLDAELVYPTGLGFPLTLGVTGTSAVHLKTSGKIDLIAIYKNPLSTAIQIALEPSASIRIAGSLIVEGCGIESGLKVITTLHTATGTDISVKLLEGNGVDVVVGVPKQKQELISITSEVLISSGAKGDNYVAPKFSKGKDHSDCFDQLASIIGFTVCGKISYPYDTLAAVQKKPIFPLSGPASFAIYLENNDVRSYHFKAFYNTANPKARSVEILLETPNSRTNRRISLLVEAALEPEKLVRVVFDSPWKKASIEGILKTNANEQTLTLTFHHDSIEYFVRGGIVASGNKYRPVLEYKVPDHIEKLAGVKNGVKNVQRGGQQYTAGGVIEVSNYNGGKRYVLEKVSLSSSGQALISIDGSIAASQTSSKADLKIEYGGDTYSLNGDATLTNRLNHKTELSVVPARNKDHGFSISFESKGTSDLISEQTLVIVHGSDLNSQTKRITYIAKQNVRYVSTQDFDLAVERKLTYPELGLVVSVEGGLSPKSIDYDLEFKYAKFNLESELSAKTGIAKPGDFEIEFEAKLQANSIEFKTKRVIINEHKNKFATSLELHPGGKYELEAVLDYDVKPENINTHLDAELKVNGKKATVDVALEANQNRVNSRADVNYEGAKYVDFDLTLLRGNNPNGNLKLNLKNYLTANGKFRYQKGSAGDAQIEINIPKFNRKVTGHGEVSITGSKHVANVEILYDAAKDPKKRLKVSSDNDFTSSSYDTKNIIELMDYKTVVNAKGSNQGQVDNGRQNAEFDVTLPNGRYIVGKFSRDVTTKDGLMDGQMQYELTDYVTKGGQSRKLIYHPEVHDLNVKTYTFRAKHDLRLINFNGDDIKLILQLKNLPNGEDKKSMEVQVDLSGSKIPSPFSLQFSAVRENDSAYGSGSLRTSLGNKLSLQATGNYVRGNNVDKPMTSETMIDIKLPSDKLKSIKLELSESLLTPKEAGGRFEYIEKNQLTYNDDKTIKFDSHFTNAGIWDRSHTTEGTGKVTVGILSNSPVTVGYEYKHNPLNELKETFISLKLNAGGKQTSVALDSSYSKTLNILNVNMKATTPIEKIRNVELQLTYKITDLSDGKTSSAKSDVTLILDQVKYTFNYESQILADGFDLHAILVSPEGKIEEIIKIRKLGERAYSGEYKLSSPKGFINLDGNVNIPSIDDFSIILNFDSDYLKTRRIHTEITNKIAKAGKRILLTLTSDGKNIITGSTNYKKHSEGNKIIVEGNGSLKIHENTKSSSFKYTQQQLTSDVDGETGSAIIFNLNFGQSSIVGEFKLTNKELHILNSYCEQSADCAQFNLQAKLTNAEFRRSMETIIEVDLRKFNVPYEFGLKANQVADLQSGFDQTATLYLHSTKEKTQYSYHIYGHPLESGIVLTLPSRELALLGVVEFPKNRRSGTYKIDISAYMDRKGRPKEKTSLTMTGDVAMDKNSGSLSGETRFSYPSHPKDLTVKGKLHFGGAHLLDGNLDIDVFENRNQKIVVVAKLLKTPINEGYNVTGTVSVSSQGQHLSIGLDEHVAFSRNEIGFGSFLTYTDKQRKPKSAGILFSANLQEAHLLINSPDQQLIRADTRTDLTKNLQKVQTDVTVFGKDPVVIILEVKDLNSFKYLYQTKNNPNNKLEATGRIVLGQVAEIQADSYKNGGKKELFHILLHLDDRQYLKPDLTFNKDNIAQVIDSYRTRVMEIVKLTNEFVKNLSLEIIEEFKDLFDHLKRAKPNLKPLIDHYVAQLNQLKDELNIETEGLKEIQRKLKEIFGGPIAAISDAIKKITAHFEELHRIYTDLVDRIYAAFKSTLPELQKSWRAFTAALNEIIEGVASLVTTYIKTLVDIFNAHKDEFKQIAIIASELIRDVSSIVLRAVSKVQNEIKDFFEVLIAELKALPIYEMIKQKYKEILEVNVSNVVIRVLDDIVLSIQRFLPTKALVELVSSVHEYIVAHVKQEKVDEVKELKKLWVDTLQAIQSIIELVRSRDNTNDFVNILQSRIPFDFSAVSKLPGITTLKISVISLLRNRELPSLNELIYAYRPALRVGNLVPPFNKFAVFLDGGHFFTFDGRHLTYPGKCSYVLAQDARDGNFSIVAELNNGNLISVTVTEPKESITIQSTGAVLVNNQPADFPASTKNLHAYVKGPSIKLSSDYGAELICNRKAPLICWVYVSGFYHGKLRGILGNGNNEPSDDFMIPSGQVTESVSAFGDAYKLSAGCPATQAGHHHSSRQSAVCNEFFTGNSPLSACFNYVDPKPYREGCEHSASGGQKEGPCLVAAAYYYVCRESGIFVKVPTTCGACQVGNQKINIGDTFSVQHPKQQADIIIVLEQATENAKVFHEMIVPLIPIIKSELKEHGITDVHVGLIGFGDQLDLPQHYTLKGSLNIDGDVKNIKFTDRRPTISYEEAKAGDLKKKVEFLGQKLEVELGTFKLVSAYEEALAYDFRPGASRTIVGVLATPCEKSVLPISLQQLRLLLGYKAYSDLGLTYHQIATLDDILISGKAVKNVVGFDSDSVFTFADSKKRPVEGSSELKNNMLLASNDVCATFAAASGGAAFSAHNFLEAKANQKRQFLQVAGRRLVSSLVNTEIQEDCVCRQAFGIYPKPECKIVSRKEKEPVGRPTKGGVKG